MMFIYSVAADPHSTGGCCPKQIRSAVGRVAALVWSFLLFGVLAVLTFQQQIGKLLGG